MRFAYYPGCALHASAKEYDMSIKAVCKALDIELQELEDWNCCGASAAYSISHLLSIALPARNLAIAEGQKMDVIVPCSECFHKLSKANISLKEKPGLKEKINKVLEVTGLEYKGEIEVRHPVDVIVNEVGLERIEEKVTKRLEGLKVAPYYGCLLVKPPGITNFDSPENPQSLDRLIVALSAEPVPYHGYKTLCCGGPILLTKEEAALKLSMDLLTRAKEAGADCVITACPLCHMLLDAKQATIEAKHNTKIDIPVLYFTQLIGLALGIKPKKLGLDKNLVSPMKVVERF